MRQRPWQEDDIKRILIDPFSSFLVAPALVEEHELAVSTNEWIDTNKSLIESLGAETWLQQAVSALEGKEVPDERVNPYRAINIDPRFAEKHSFIIPRDEWLRANAKLMPQVGVEEWLNMFLDILEGGIPNATDLGFVSSPAGDAPFGYTAEEPYLQRKYSFRQGGKRRNKKRRRK